MKTKLLYSLACAAMLTMGMTSCESKLDIPEKGVLNYETFYQTDEDAESAVSAIYLQINSSKYNFHMCINALGDDFWSGGGARNDNSDLEQFNEYTFGTEASYIKNLFESYYTVIYKCNVVLGHVGAGKDASELTEVENRSLAEAHVLRAWAYFYLINLWGTPPIVDHELEAAEYSQPNGSKEELWALVESDLTEAINGGHLPEKTDVNDNTTWRVTKQFAQALLGKAYLWNNEYGKAADEFQKVIDSGKYELYSGAYGDILGFNTKHNCESMFESNRAYNANSPWGNMDLTAVMCHWRIDKMSAPADYSGLESAQGWGFLTPQKSLYEDFVKVEGENGYRLGETMKTYEQIQAMGWSVKQAIICEGYFMWKWRFLDEQGPTGTYAMVDDNNPRWMRYAEVLLCAAEAYDSEGGHEANVKKCMDLIRNRAKAPTQASYTTEDIRREKRIELCGEYTRYFDILRWGTAYELLKDQGSKLPFLNPNGTVTYSTYNTNPNLYGFKQGKNELLPFPGTEVRLNSNIVQNPGW